MLRWLVFGGRADEELAEALRAKKCAAEKMYDDVLSVEYDIRAPELATAIIKYREEG